MTKDYDLTNTPANQVRRQDYACDDAWIEAFLERAQVGHIATRWDEQPFITPLLYWYDSARREIYVHTNITGRLRANCERHPEACFEACEMGRLLPANTALEFGMQYESVVVFGKMRVVAEPAEQKRILYGLIEKYFPGMQPGREYRPIIDEELRRTAVLALEVESWSGKRNWKEQAKQSPDWAPLDSRWL